MSIGLLVGVWLARYLGPEQFGLFNYASAIAALFTAIGTLGLNSIVVRDLVKHPSDATSTLGTAFLLQLIGGLLAIIVAIITVNLLRPNDQTTKIVVAIVSSTMVFKASDVIRYWFEARTQSKYTVWAESVAFLLFSGIKIWLIIASAPLLAFAWIVLAEAALVAGLLLLIYTQQGNSLFTWQYHYPHAKRLLGDSWPLILSSLASMLYMRIDQIMLGQMLGDAAVGIYSAAARISEVWYFIPIAIVNSTLPRIIKIKSENKKKYLETIQNLYDLLIGFSIFVAIATTFLAHKLIHLLYGNHFSESATILSMQIWAGVFVTMGVARGPWIICEGLQKYTYQYIGLAMIVNILSNIILIPRFGPIGASASSIAAQATTALLAPSLFSATRVSVKMLLHTINPARYITKATKNWKSK